MGTLMVVKEVRNHVETGLVDDALERIMDSVEEDIDQEFGAVASQVDDLEGKTKSIFMTRPIGSITSIMETVGTTDITLATNDYKRRHNSQIDRLNTGTNSRNKWGDRVLVTYVPVDDTKRRQMVYIRLIELALKYNALKGENSGDYSSTSAEYEKERLGILRGLRRGGFFA